MSQVSALQEDSQVEPIAAGDAVAATDAGDSAADDKEAIEALKQLSQRQFARLTRRVPLRTFLPELERLDRAVFYRHFKGYRPQKLMAAIWKKCCVARFWKKATVFWRSW